jgi:plasmid stabilization system protein ParE
MAEPIVTAAAERDYLESLIWYGKRSQRAAEGFEAEFENALTQIAAAPLRFARCDQRHRRFLMRRYPYQVVYRSEGDDIVVIAVAHAKRKPLYWKNR